MRISTLHIFNIANNSMANAKEALAKTNEQILNRKKIISAADDPVAATRIQLLSDNLASIDQYNKNIAMAENNLTVEETTLKSVTNLLQRIEELAVQAGNTASLSPTEYRALADEVDVRLDELLNLSNTRNANGDYIFSGYKSGQPAFVGDTTNGFRYQGDEGQLRMKIDHNTYVDTTDSGKSIFVDIPSVNNTITTDTNPNNRANPAASISIGEVVNQSLYDEFYPEDIVITFNEDSNVVPSGKNFTVTERSTGKIIEANHRYVSGETLTYHGVNFHLTGSPASADTGANLSGDQFFINSTNTQDMLTTMMRFRDVMENYDGTQTTKDQLTQVVASTLSNLENAQEAVSTTVTKIGARVNTLDSTKEQHADTKLVSNEILSDLRDLDYAEAAIRLSAQTLVLQAAQASFLRISELTLFSRL